MTRSPATLLLRDALPRHAFAIARLLTAALQDSAVGRWIDPDPASRPAGVMRYTSALLDRMLDTGIVRVIEQSGEIVAAALWSLNPRAALSPVPAGGVADGLAGDRVRDRLALLDKATQTLRLWHLPQHQLVMLGVRPDQQRQGLARRLLSDQHAALAAVRVTAYAVAVDGPAQQVLESCGYSAISAAQVLPDRVSVWAMCRAPTAAG